MKKNILVNFYPFVLWNTRVYGRVRQFVQSNLYQREVEFEQINDNEVHVKSDFVDGPAKKANAFEYLLIKYLPAALLVYLLFNINLYYVSQVGLMLASVAYVGFFVLRERDMKFFGWLYLVSLFLLYILLFSIYPKSFVELKGNWIINYAVQYFVLFYVVQAVLENVFTERLKSTYKIQKYYATYFVLNSDDIKESKEIMKWKVKRYFKWFLGVVFLIGAFFGGLDIAYKIAATKAAQKKILTESRNEAEILRQRNAGALLELLEKQSKEVGIKVHTKEDIELLKSDFDEYKRVGVISYGTVAFSKNNKVIEMDTGKQVYFGFKKRNQIYKKAWVKLYKDGYYRWHFKNAGKIYVITDVKAR